jgi:hypothetical protein
MFFVNKEYSLISIKSRNETYNVKSAYYSAVEELIDNTVSEIEGEWTMIWSLKILYKN